MKKRCSVYLPVFFSEHPMVSEIKVAEFIPLLCKLTSYMQPINLKQFRQEPITRSEQLPCARVTAFSRTGLFLERLWREF